MFDLVLELATGLQPFQKLDIKIEILLAIFFINELKVTHKRCDSSHQLCEF